MPNGLVARANGVRRQSAFAAEVARPETQAPGPASYRCK